MPRRTDQEEPIKVTQFARPALAYDDEPIGFAFTKAKLPQMDFSRKSIGQTTAAKAQEEVLEAPVQRPAEVPPSRDTNVIKVTTSHILPPRGTGFVDSVDLTQGPNDDQGIEGTVFVDSVNHSLERSEDQGIASQSENLVTGSKLAAVRNPCALLRMR